MIHIPRTVSLLWRRILATEAKPGRGRTTWSIYALSLAVSALLLVTANERFADTDSSLFGAELDEPPADMSPASFDSAPRTAANDDREVLAVMLRKPVARGQVIELHHVYFNALPASELPPGSMTAHDFEASELVAETTLLAGHPVRANQVRRSRSGSSTKRVAAHVVF